MNVLDGGTSSRTGCRICQQIAGGRIHGYQPNVLALQLGGDDRLTDTPFLRLDRLSITSEVGAVQPWPTIPVKPATKQRLIWNLNSSARRMSWTVAWSV